MLSLPSNPQLYSAVIVIAGAIYGVGKTAVHFIRRRAQRDLIHTMQSTFITDMATNHLPHIYHALEALCNVQGVELTDPPPIRFVVLEERNEIRTNQASN